ncbi:MAG: hypothetical protein JNM27_19040 [Leptospirales bacterium]|nr:hypothetical protein [Leptospirales bacterium]
MKIAKLGPVFLICFLPAMSCATTSLSNVDFPVYFGKRIGGAPSKDFNAVVAKDEFLLLAVQQSAGMSQASALEKALINNSRAPTDWATIQSIDVSSYTIIILPWMMGTATNDIKARVEHAK